MEITWLGHSCFRLKSTHGVLITDPYSPDTGYIMGKQTARIVTVSHQHPDHNFTQGISGEPKIVDRPGEYEISDTLIVGINTFHDNEQGKLRGRNVICLIEMDDISICHMGDLGHTLNSQQVEQLQHIDVLMLPVGGITTLDGAMAAEVVRQLSPKIVIPMHYKTPALKNQELETADRFLTEMGVTTTAIPQPKLGVTKSTIPETMQVYILEYPQGTPPAV